MRITILIWFATILLGSRQWLCRGCRHFLRVSFTRPPHRIDRMAYICTENDTKFANGMAHCWVRSNQIMQIPRYDFIACSILSTICSRHIEAVAQTYTTRPLVHISIWPGNASASIRMHTSTLVTFQRNNGSIICWSSAFAKLLGYSATHTEGNISWTNRTQRATVLNRHRHSPMSSSRHCCAGGAAKCTDRNA